MTDDRVLENEGGGPPRQGAAVDGRVNLLARLRAGDGQAAHRLVRLLGPLVMAWCRQKGLGPSETLAATADVFREAVGSASEFSGAGDQGGEGSTFPGWVKGLTAAAAARVLEGRGSDGHELEHGHGNSDTTRTWPFFGRLIGPGPGPGPPAAVPLDGETEARYLVRSATELVLEECDETTRRAFHGVVVAGRSAAAVATEMGVSAGSVRVAVATVARKLRAEFGGVVEF